MALQEREVGGCPHRSTERVTLMDANAVRAHRKTKTKMTSRFLQKLSEAAGNNI